MNIGKTIKNTIAYGLVIAGCGVYVPPAHADWVDSWFNQKSVTSPGYFQGQQAGYFTGGSFSARYQTGSEHLFAFQPPKLSVGCGGVDAFMGSMKFIDLNHLVQKLKTIMVASAPMFAFDLGMKYLSPQVSETLGKIESMLERLNQIQLDDCKAAKAISADLSESVYNKSIHTENLQAFSIQSGANDLFTDMKSIWKADKGKNPAEAATNQPNNSNVPSMKQDCTAEVKDLFFNGGTLLRKKAKEMNIDPEVISVVRAILGDVAMQPVANKWEPEYITYCPGTNVISAEDFLSKNYYIKTCNTDAAIDQEMLSGGSSGVQINSKTTCNCIKATGDGFSTQFYNDFKLIKDAMLNKTAITDPSVIRKLNEIPLPIYKTLKTSVATKMSDSMLTTLSGLAARAYAYRMMADMYALTDSMIAKAKHDALAAKNPKAEGEEAKCDASAASATAAILETYTEQLRRTVANLQGDYNNALNETLTSFQLSQSFKQYEDISKRVLGSRVMPQNVYKRITSGQ